MSEPSAKEMNNPNINQCFGNFCTLSNPDCRYCAIDEALDELEQRLTNNASQDHLLDKKRVAVSY
jgi:hypothetical protein